jgi:hypothetical protein
MAVKNANAIMRVRLHLIVVLMASATVYLVLLEQDVNSVLLLTIICLFLSVSPATVIPWALKVWTVTIMASVHARRTLRAQSVVPVRILHSTKMLITRMDAKDVSVLTILINVVQHQDLLRVR